MPTLIPSYNRQNVLVGLAAVYVQPFDPLTPAVLPDDDSVPLGGTWSPPWVSVGASQEGLSFNFSRETNDIVIAEQMTPVDVPTESMDVRAEITLAEDTLESMKLAYGGGTITTTAPGTGTVGTRELRPSSNLEHLALGFEATQPDGFWRRVLLPEVVSAGEVETGYQRAEEQRLYACSFRLLTKPEDVIIREMNAAAQ